MAFGSMPRDGGGLILSHEERDAVLASAPTAARFVRRYVGASELLKGRHRYCLWVPDSDAAEAAAIPILSERFEIVRRERAKSPAASTHDAASTPWRFVQRAHREGASIVVPLHSSERREIIPMGFLDSATVISNAAAAVYGAEPWLFALLQSRMHIAWVATVGGRIKSDYRYSAELCYNTFPVPVLSDHDRDRLTRHAFGVLEARERYSDRALGDLYLPDEMPADLKRTHEQLDATVDALYGAASTPTDTQRLEILFKRYDEMSAAEAAV